MEKKPKPPPRAASSSSSSPAILVAVNALSALGVLQARSTRPRTRSSRSRRGAGTSLRSLKQSMQVDAYVTKGLPKLDAFVRDLRDLLQEYKDAGGGQVRLLDHRGRRTRTRRRRPRTPASSSSRSARRATPSEKAAVAQGFMGLVFKYGAEKDVIKFLPPGPHRRPRVLDHEQDPRDSRQGRQHQAQDRRPHRPRRDQAHRRRTSCPSQHGQGPSMQAIITQNFPFYTFQDVDLKGGDERDRRRPRRPHHHPARQGPDREGAPPHRPVRDEGQVARRLRQRGEREGERRDDERDAEHARPRQAPRRLRHHDEQGRRPRLRPHASASSCSTQGGHRAAPRSRRSSTCRTTPRFTGNEQLLDTSFPGFFRLARDGRSRSRRRSRSTRTSSRRRR